jgi:hypothetical protein
MLSVLRGVGAVAFASSLGWPEGEGAHPAAHPSPSYDYDDVSLSLNYEDHIGSGSYDYRSRYAYDEYVAFHDYPGYAYRRYPEYRPEKKKRIYELEGEGAFLTASPSPSPRVPPSPDDDASYWSGYDDYAYYSYAESARDEYTASVLFSMREYAHGVEMVQKLNDHRAHQKMIRHEYQVRGCHKIAAEMRGVHHE